MPTLGAIERLVEGKRKSWPLDLRKTNIPAAKLLPHNRDTATFDT